MILHQGAGDMDNRYFPGKHRPETMPFGIGCSFKSRHFGFDFILVWRMPTPVWPGWQHSRKGGTAGKADNLRAAFCLRGAGYEPHEHV